MPGPLVFVAMEILGDILSSMEPVLMDPLLLHAPVPMETIFQNDK